MGYFYVEAKSFAILLEIGNFGIRFAETIEVFYQVVLLGTPNVGVVVKDGGVY